MMARRAFETEKARRMSQPAPRGREVDIGAHHIVLQYLECYTKTVFFGSMFRGSPEFAKMRDVKRFAEDACAPVCSVYTIVIFCTSFWQTFGFFQRS